MKIGFSIVIDEMAKLDDCGLDYFGANLSKITSMSEEEFAEAKAFLKTLKTPVKVCNVLLPGNLKIVGPECDVAHYREYLEMAFMRATEIGADMIVFGSGGAKHIPEGFDRDTAMDQLCVFIRILAELAEKYDVIIPIEALRSAECNCINNLDEAEWLCDAANSKHITMLADWYHMYGENDLPARMEALGSKLRHVHVARPDNRKVPFIGDGFDYSEYFAALKNMGYDAGLTFEGGFDDVVDDCNKYVAFIRYNLK